MAMHPRSPSTVEVRRRRRHLGTARRLAPLAGTLARPRLQRWVERRFKVARSEAPGFYLPLPLVEVAWGALPERYMAVESVRTIMADWAECDGVMINSTDWFLSSGDWSPLVRSTDGDPVREEATQLWVAGLQYRSTPAYARLVEDVRHQAAPRRQGRTLNSTGGVDAYFDRFAALFRSIEQHGVLPQSDVVARGLSTNGDRGLGIAIDADGTIHRLQGGNHRWAIAQVLELPEVPVEVRLVHVDAIGKFWEVPGTAP